MRAARTLLAGTMSLAAALSGVAFADVAVAAPTTRYVAKSGVDAANDCRAKATPCLTIQHAVDQAATGDTVSIGKGTFVESVLIGKPLTLQGDPAGDTVIRAEDDQPSVQTVANQPGGIEVTLQDLDISGNKTAPGVVAVGALLTVVDSYVDRNSGGVLALGSLVAFGGSTASGNGLSDDDDEGENFFGNGFGLLVLGGAVQTDQSSFEDNQFGGVVVSSDFETNRRAAAAPAVTDADSTIVDSTVAGNGEVGVIAQGGSLDVDTSTISGNASIGLYAAQSAVTVRNSTVAATGNKILSGTDAPTTPAGVYNDTRPTTTDRDVLRTAGLTARSSKVTVGKLTVTVRATAQRRAPAAAPVGITLSGTALDQSGTVRDCVSVLDGGYNSSADAVNSCGFGAAKKDLVRTDAKLGPLADNGGLTFNHLPAFGSPLLNAVPAGQADCKAGVTDQRGTARPQNVRCDIGAVEVKLAPVRITTKALPDGQVGDKYSLQLAATGGDGDYAWTLAKGSSLPDGLTLSRAGVISGTPTESGKFTITVLADGASKRFTLVIDAAGAAPNGDGQDPIAETGAASASLMTWGTALLLAGFAVMLFAGHVGRRPGRHRT